jgi:hypothetical protein
MRSLQQLPEDVGIPVTDDVPLSVHGVVVVPVVTIDG